MIPTLATAAAVVVGTRGGTHQLSQGQGYTRREVKGHTRTPTTTTTVRGGEEETGEAPPLEVHKNYQLYFLIQEETFMAEMKLGIVNIISVESITCSVIHAPL